MSRSFLWALLVLVTPLGYVGDARADIAAPNTEAPGPHLETVGDDELAQQRGGFRIGTLDVRLGAEITSYIGGALVMQTNVNWGDAGASIERTAVANVSAEVVASNSLTALLAAQKVGVGLGGQNALSLNGGQTLFLQRADNAIQNVIVNTANGVDLRQQIDATIDIGGYSPFHDGILAARVGSALANTIGLSSLAVRSN